MPVQVSLSDVLLPSQRHLLRKVRIVPLEETEKPTHCFPTKGVSAAVVKSRLEMVVAEISINKCFFDALFEFQQAARVESFLKSKKML
jgi:hypothetical protein